MQTVTTEQARETLPELLKQVENGPVLIRDGNQDIAVLVSPDSFNPEERKQQIARFEKIRTEASEELRANLAKEGRTVDEFLEDLFKEE